MINALPPTLRNPLFWDKVLVGGLSLYSLGIFLPSITALERLGLVTALMISLFGGRWRICLGYLTHPAMLLLFALLAWFTLSIGWSVDAPASLASVKGVFKDYLLLVPPLFYLLADAQRRRLFALALALWGGVIVVLNGIQYVQELMQDPALLANIKLHRGWGHPLVFLLPFALLQARLAKGRQAALWYGLFAIETAMIIATGARGAWLALLVALVLWVVHDFDRRRVLGLLAVGLVLSASAYFILPDRLVKDRVAQGMDTSLRTTGTWGPTLQMLDERPWLGYGFSKEIFDQEFNRRAPLEESWTIKKSKGPHSIYLEAAFSGGYVALVLVSLVFLALFGYGMAAARSRLGYEERMLALAALASFTAFFITRGGFESVRWAPLPIVAYILVYCAREGRRARAG